MKTLILTFVMLLELCNLLGQDYAELNKVPLSNTQECKAAEPKVIECSNILLNSPCIDDIPTLNIMQFLLEWMGATPDYSFGFEKKFHKTIKTDLALVSRYLAAMSTYEIENNHQEPNKLQFESIKIVLDYCENENNEVKISKKLEKYIEAKNAGELEDLITE